MSLVCIIILNYNNWQDTIECLESVCRLQDDAQIIVVDNGSIDDSWDRLLSWAQGSFIVTAENPAFNRLIQPNVQKPIKFQTENAKTGTGDVSLVNNRGKHPIKFIRSMQNLGYAGGNNIGLRTAIAQVATEYFWILNNDVVVESKSLDSLIKKCEGNDNIGICGSRVMYYYEPTSIQSIGGYYNRFFSYVKNITDIHDRKRIDAVIGASLFITRRCIETIGFLPEEYFLYLEESDYCLRAKQYGFCITVADDSIVFHKSGSTTGGNDDYRKRGEVPDLLMLKNRFILAKKYSRSNMGVYIGLLISVIRRLLRGQPRRSYKIMQFMTEQIFKTS